MAGIGLLAEQRQDAVGEADDRLVRGRGEEMAIAEILDRLGGGLGDLRPAIADIDAPQTGAEIDQAAPVLILDPDAIAVGEDRRTVLEMVAHRGHRVEQALLVHLLERVIPGGGGGHGGFSWLRFGRWVGLPIVGGLAACGNGFRYFSTRFSSDSAAMRSTKPLGQLSSALRR